MKVVMYHYVRTPFTEFPNIYALHPDDFKRQLDYFSSEYGFVSREDTVQMFHSGHVPDGILLTFDDGLIDHYDTVFPILKERGLWGIFYVSAMPLIEKTLLNVHRIHALLSRFSHDEIWKRLTSLIREEILPKEQRHFYNTVYLRQPSHHVSVSIKKVLNYLLTYPQQCRILDILMTDFFRLETPSHAAFYLSPQQLTTMANEGMWIGSHSMTHRVSRTMTPNDFHTDVQQSFAIIDQYLDTSYERTFCYPYGGHTTFTPDHEAVLKDIECMCAFMVDPRDVQSHDVIHRPHALPRYDCNQFAFGTARRFVSVS